MSSAVIREPNNPSPCIINEHWLEDVVVIACTGVLDMLTAPDLGRRIDDAFDKQPTAMIVDLTAVDFLSAHGMTVLMETHDRLGGSAFIVVADGPATSRPMMLVGLAAVLTMCSTLDAAIAITDESRSSLSA